MSCESCHKELCKFAKKNLCRYGCYNCVNYVCYCKKVSLPDSSRIGVCKKSKSDNLKKPNPKLNPRYDVDSDGCCTDCYMPISAGFQSNNCGCVVHEQPSIGTHKCCNIDVCTNTSKDKKYIACRCGKKIQGYKLSDHQKRCVATQEYLANLPPRQDISTITSRESLDATIGKVYWTNGSVELGLYERSFNDCDSSFGSNKPYLIYRFSNASILDQELFPRLRVAVSSSGGGGGSANSTTKVGGSATAKVGGSATAKVDSSDRANVDTAKVVYSKGLNLITSTNFDEMIELIYKTFKDNTFVFSYLGKDKSIVKLGSSEKHTDPERGRRYFSFSENETTIYTIDCFRKLIKDKSFDGLIEFIR